MASTALAKAQDDINSFFLFLLKDVDKVEKDIILNKIIINEHNYMAYIREISRILRIKQPEIILYKHNIYTEEELKSKFYKKRDIYDIFKYQQLKLFPTHKVNSCSYDTKKNFINYILSNQLLYKNTPFITIRDEKIYINYWI